MESRNDINWEKLRQTGQFAVTPYSDEQTAAWTHYVNLITDAQLEPDSDDDPDRFDSAGPDDKLEEQ